MRFEIKKNLRLEVLAPVFLATFMAVGVAHAQNLSGRGVDSRAAGEVSCLAEVERLEVIVYNLEALREAMIECNERGAVYAGQDSALWPPEADADGCVPLGTLTANWLPNPGAPDDLEFEDPISGDTHPRIDVIRGEDGADATCPPDHESVPQ